MYEQNMSITGGIPSLNMNPGQVNKAKAKARFFDTFRTPMWQWKRSAVAAINYRIPFDISLEKYTKLMTRVCRFCGTNNKYNTIFLWPKKLKLGYVENNLQSVCKICHRKRASFRDFISRKRNIDLEK